MKTLIYNSTSMKKQLALIAFLPLLMCACTAPAPVDNTGSGEDTSTPSPTDFDLVKSFEALHGKNMTVRNTYDFLSKLNDRGAAVAPITESSYLDEGVAIRYINFGTTVDSTYVEKATDGFVNKDGVASYFSTKEVTVGNNKSTVVDESTVTPISGGHSDFRDAVYTLNDIVEADFNTSFVPQIAGTTFGTFDLKSSADSVNHEKLVKLAKCLGVYDAISSDPKVDIDYATLYFFKSGAQFTFTFYLTYDGFSEPATVKSVVSKIGTTTSDIIAEYLEPKGNE